MNHVEEKYYYSNIDFLRGIAVLMTIAAHYSPIEIPYLWYGVSIFFAISGFLITDILLRKKEQSLPVSQILRKFYIRRALRLFPLYYLFIFFFWALLHFANLHLWQDRFNYYFLFYAPNFLISKISLGGAMGFAHLWSLGVEEQFYLLWPIILLLMPRKFISVTIVVFICVGVFFETTQFSVNINMHLMPFSHFHTLCGGALVAYLKIHSPKVFHVIHKYRIHLLCLTTIFLLYFLVVDDFDLMRLSFFRATSLALFTSILVFCHLFALPTFVMQSSVYHILIYIGKISYGLYIIHMPIPYLVRAVMMKTLPNYQISEYFVLLISLLFTFLSAALSFKYFESYFIRLKEKFE